jgi:two-component system phosphate regulon sensor histidine kinase PhoR
MNASKQDWLLVAGLLGVALVGGWITGAYGWMMCLATFTFAIIQHREYRAFVRWSQNPLGQPGNHLQSWREAVTNIQRTLTNARSRNRRSLSQLRALRVIADAIPDAGVIIDTGGHIEAFNAAAVALLHIDKRNHGVDLSSLLRQPDFVELVRGEGDLSIANEVVEFASPFNDDTRLEARRITLEQDQALILVRDVTQLNRLLSMRQDFIANVSHELRTPLTVVVGYLETLTSEPLDRKTTRELIGRLESPTRRMQALVDDLLLLTRLEASPAPTDEELSFINMGTLLESVIADARALSAGAHRFETNIDNAHRVLGVESELHSACANLVTNAVRYSPDGGDIDVYWGKIASGSRLAVHDRGLGIPSEHLSRLTERFYRVDLAKARVRGGTGLGLAIVKHVLKRHHSQLQIHSELGVGSTFFCDFPSPGT